MAFCNHNPVKPRKMSEQAALRIGTRGSPLALTQTNMVVERLREANPYLAAPGAVETVVIKTMGDRVQHELLSAFGGKGLFTKELDEAMLEGRIDIAIHSMKDMPTVIPDGLAAMAICVREDPRDAFISPKAKTLAQLPKGSRVGTASLRRAAQVLHRRPDLQVVGFRGNVDTRLRKLEEGQADATFLAAAGLNRLGKSAVITSLVPLDEMLPAVGQGILCATCRADDAKANALLAQLIDPATSACAMAERAMLAILDGSCRTPIAGYARMDGSGSLTLLGAVAHPAGTEYVEASASGLAADAEAIGGGLAQELLSKASADLLNAIREDMPMIIKAPSETDSGETEQER